MQFQPVSMPLQNIADYCMSRFDPWTSFPALECSATGKQFTYGDVRTMARQFGSQLLDSGKHDLLITPIPWSFFNI